MQAKATTIRFEPEIRDQLVQLSKILDKPINRLANEAVRDFVLKTTIEVEQNLESTLANLRAYRKNDPNFEHAIAEFVEAEASVHKDPAEGEVLRKTKMGPTEQSVRTLLRGG